MTQLQALAILIGLIVVLFAGIYWLANIAPTSGSRDDDGDSDQHSSHGGGHSGDGPTIGPA